MYLSSPLIRRFVAGSALLFFGMAVQGCESDADIDTAEEEVESLAQDPVPEWMEPQTETDRVAAEVHQAHGGPEWDSVQTVEFVFVVESDDERVMEAAHHWEVADGTDRVEWSDGEGRDWEVVVDIDAESALEASIDGEALDGDKLEEAGEQGYRRWVNDTYWLLMPIKLFDPGVERSLIDEDSGHKESPFDAIELSFESVGITPGDRYVVRVDGESREILSWTMDLEGRDELTDVEWKEYQSAGPLRLPIERHWREADRRIVFEGLEVR